MDRAAPFRLDEVDLADVAATLAGAGYVRERVASTLGSATAHGELDAPYLRRRVAEPTPFHTLVRLFHLGDGVDPVDAGDALGPRLPEALTRAGLLVRDGGRVRATAQLVPYRHLLLASDFREGHGHAALSDHVMGAAPTSDIVARLTVRRLADAALDVGTGTGLLALLCARHARRVVGTDPNPRALAFARLNARLNGIDQTRFERGPFLEPVEDETFDLVVSNPPFAISPESRYQYRDGGERGDRVSERIVRDAADRLKVGGFATILVSWHHTDEDDWAERPRHWTRAADCDVWLLRGHSVDPLAYAAFFLRQTELGDPARYDRLLDEWLRYYEDLGIRRLAIGTIVMRRRDGPGWFRADTIPTEDMLGDCGAHIESVFTAEDLLRGFASPRDLLGMRLRLRPGHVLEHRLALEDGQWVAHESRLVLREGFRFTGEVDAPVVHLLQGCDGRRTFGEAVARLAGMVEEERAAVEATALRMAQHMLRTGVLIPA